MNKDQKQLEKCFAKILQILKVANKEVLENTPTRASKALLEMNSSQKLLDEITWKTFEIENGSEMVLIKDIEFSSLCEHHLLPFVGKASVAYLPNERVVGLSKIPRLVKALSQKLQLQERLTKEIAEILSEKLQPKGVAVFVSATHSCMSLRGVKSNSTTLSYKFIGEFEKNQNLRKEFLDLIK